MIACVRACFLYCGDGVTVLRSVARPQPHARASPACVDGVASTPSPRRPGKQEGTRDAAPHQVPALDDAARAGVEREGPLHEALRRVDDAAAVLTKSIQGQGVLRLHGLAALRRRAGARLRHNIFEAARAVLVVVVARPRGPACEQECRRRRLDGVAPRDAERMRCWQQQGCKESCALSHCASNRSRTMRGAVTQAVRRDEPRERADRAPQSSKLSLNLVGKTAS